MPTSITLPSGTYFSLVPPTPQYNTPNVSVLFGVPPPCANPIVCPPCPLEGPPFSMESTGGTGAFYNDGGVLAMAALPPGWQEGSAGLSAGAVYSNGLTVGVVPGITPDPATPALYFGQVSTAQLLAIGGGNLPLTQPALGSKQLWNLAGQVCIA